MGKLDVDILSPITPSWVIIPALGSPECSRGGGWGQDFFLEVTWTEINGNEEIEH